MMCESFLEKCAAVDHVLSIAIPGSKIPSWFEEQRHGNQIALKFPPKCHTDILGFAVCGVLRKKWQRENVQTLNASEIHFTVGTDSRLIREPEVDDTNASAAATEDESMWIVYIPFTLFQEQMYDDFGEEDRFLFARGNLIINILEPKGGYTKIVRCGAHIMYKEDVGSLHPARDYKNSNLVRRLDDSFAYIEKFRNIDLQIPL
ncbi:hypothetical protein L6452_08368 [Arctium lappa]|uniref:Uncharacterized protein n=1 Tax=Arctium lappa TaxID=4217 RepID=A0ACB9DHI0_ARCLA|nr:hypothetical protein L6452_08368 [Arctium lappa]